MTTAIVNHCPDCDAPYSAVTVDQSIDLAKWVSSLTEEECRGLLHYLCGYRPELIAMLKAEQEDPS